MISVVEAFVKSYFPVLWRIMQARIYDSSQYGEVSWYLKNHGKTWHCNYATYRIPPCRRGHGPAQTSVVIPIVMS